MGKNFVTPEEVARAAEELVQEGKKPTVTAVRERLGKGSRTTIAKHLNTWSEERIAKLIPLAKHVGKQMAEISRIVDKTVGPMRKTMEQITRSVEELGAWRVKSVGLSTDSLEQMRRAVEQLNAAGEELRRSLGLSAAAKAMEDVRESLKAFEGYGKKLGVALGEQAGVLENARAAVDFISLPPLPNTADKIAGFRPTTFPKTDVSSAFSQIARRLERIEERLNSVESAVSSRNSEPEG